MPTKLGKKELPSGHTLEDFECFGPVAMKDGDFAGSKIADLGCFDQDGKDSNKFYHGAVVKSKTTGKFYCYFEWGRLGNGTNEFQFQECDSESEAQSVFEKQIHSKNDKRGEWFDHPALGRILRAKRGKDCYLVRVQAIRVTGLPDAKRICTKQTVVSAAISKKFDSETEKLLADLKAGNISYTKGQFSSNFIPDIQAINQARKILGEVTKANKSEKAELTKLLYSIIPKATCIGEKVELDNDNIKSWGEDLDAFEDSFNSLNSSVSNISIKYELRYVDKSDQMFSTLNRMAESATKNRHSYIPGKMKLLNIWEVTNIPDWFIRKQEEIAKSVTFNRNQVPIIFQPNRTELEKASNSFLLFHGTRSVNCGGILTTGFRLPKYLNGVTINGANLGGGIYHASDWKKSAGYCSIRNGYWSSGSGSVANRQSFMFLNEVILGNPHFVKYPKGFPEPPKGYHSVIAECGGSFQNEEYVVYETELFFPKYLIEFDI